MIEATGRLTNTYTIMIVQATQERKATAYMDRFIDPEDGAHCLKDLAHNASVGKLVLNAMDFAEEGLLERLQGLFQTRVGEWDEIVLQYCRGPVDLVIAAILKSNAKIGTLCLIASTLKDCIGEALSKGLPSNVTLAKLMIWGTTLSRKNIYSIRQGLIGNTTLEELSFTNSHIEKDATGGFCSRLSNQTHNMAGLKRLDLFSCDLQDMVVAAIVKSLDGHPNLEHLELGKNQCSAASLIAVGTLLGSHKTKLKYLNLSLQDSSKNIPFFEISHMTGGLGLNSSLESLIMRGNQLSFNGMKNLVTCLSQNTTLEHLWMKDCELGNAAMDLFVAHLPDMKGLRRVWLNGFQSTGIAGRKKTIEALETALETNVILDSIHLPFGYDDYRSSKVNVLLDLNRGGRRLLQASNNEFSHTLWPLVLERVNRMHLSGSNNSKEMELKSRRANIMYSLLRGRVLLEV